MSTDARRTRWLRILAYYQNQAGADPANDPLPGDPLRMILVRLLKAING